MFNICTLCDWRDAVVPIKGTPHFKTEAAALDFAVKKVKSEVLTSAEFGAFTPAPGEEIAVNIERDCWGKGRHEVTAKVVCNPPTDEPCWATPFVVSRAVIVCPD